MERLTRVANALSRWFGVVAVIALLLMMFLTGADVVGRLFRKPIPGAYDIVSMAGVIVFAFALTYTQKIRGHVSVDFLVLRLSQRVRAILSSITVFISLGLFVIIGWQSYLLASTLLTSGQVTMTAKIPLFPFVYLIAFCSLPMLLLLLTELLKSLSQAAKK